MKPYRVLSLDGGGIRGLYSAAVLHGIAQRVARMHGGPEERLDVGRAFDLVVGTSTGAILATALASGVSLAEVVALYRDNARKIFSDPVPQSKWPLLAWCWRHLRSPANPSAPLKAALEGVFGVETVLQMYQRRGIALCVTSVDVETQKSWVFKTPHDMRGNRLQRDNNYALVDLCMSSAAAPLVLPVHGVARPDDVAGSMNWFCDGGLWANNPVVVAIVEALEFAPPGAPIHVISASTCPPFKGAAVDTSSSQRGLLDWWGGIATLEVALDAQSYAYHYIAKTLSTHLDREVKYLRLTDPQIQAEEAKELRLDNPAALDVLAKLASRAVDLNISEATTGDKPKELLTEIFANLPTLPERSIECSTATNT